MLIVEDEEALREGLRAQLTQAGFTVDVAQDGEEGLFAGREYALDVAIVDLGLPKLPGLELIRRLRAEHKSYPILVLTARDRWQDKVEGLQAGADDYVVKPFHFQEVLARVQALLRRSGGWASAELTCGPIVLDTRRQTVAVDGQPVELTSFEYRIAGLGETPHIVEETSSIVDEPALLARPRGRLRNWNPLSAVRRNLARLFANVSRSPAR